MAELRIDPPPDPVVRLLGIVQALGEPMIALALGFLLTFLATLPLIPLRLQCEFPLRPVSTSGATLSDSGLLDRLEALEVAGSVRIVGDEEGRRRLVLEEVTEPIRALGTVRQELERAGYRRTLFWAAPDLDPTELMGADPTMVPRLLGVQAALFILVGWMLIRWRVRPGQAALGAPPRARSGPLGTVLWGLGGGVAVVVLSSIASVMLEALGFDVEEQPWVQDLLSQPDALLRLAPWIVIVVPLSEEVFFRGYFFRFVRDRLGLGIGLAYSSVVFAAIHLNPSGMPLYVIVAVVFAWTYHRSGRLAAPIIAHAVLNGFVLLAGILANRWQPP